MIRLLRREGGGTGSVWVAEHRALAVEVGVKLLSPQLGLDPDYVRRFSREAGLAAQLRSPHAAQVFDYGVTDEGQPFLVLELLDGTSLAARLDRVRRLSLDDVVTLTLQLARVLGRAHGMGLIHRDIRPDNLFLCDMGDGSLFVKVLEFGFPKTADFAAEPRTVRGVLLGTPAYMSPEQLRGQPDLDQRSDVWSLGVVVFEALVGQRPFPAESLPELTLQISSEPLPVPSQLRPELPRAFDVWFAKACAREREQRFTTVRELADALAHGVGGRAFRAPAPPPSRPVEPGAERRGDLRRDSWIPASIEVGEGAPKVALAKNISRRGALLFTRVPYALDQELVVRLHFKDGDTGYPARARVVRVSGDSRVKTGLWRSEVAVRFTPPIDDCSEELNRVIERQARLRSTE